MHADDDQHDLARGPSAAAFLGGATACGLSATEPSASRRRTAHSCLVASLVEPERRVLVAHQEHVCGDARDPAVEPEDEVEDPPWVARREEQRDRREEDEHADEAGVEAHAPDPVVVGARRRVPAAAEEDPDDDVVRDREQPPLHEDEAARQAAPGYAMSSRAG